MAKLTEIKTAKNNASEKPKEMKANKKCKLKKQETPICKL